MEPKWDHLKMRLYVKSDTLLENEALLENETTWKWDSTSKVRLYLKMWLYVTSETLLENENNSKMRLNNITVT